MTERPLRLGVSACMFHADPARAHVFNGRPLFYLERSMADLFASLGAIVYLVPPLGPDAGVSLDTLAEDLDALVLAGGVDVSPLHYGETPRRPQWSGDSVRDAYEIALLRAVVAQRKPVLGICRGHQVLNVAYGGSLHQDIGDEIAGALVHRDATVYERNRHEVTIVPGTTLARIYAGRTHGVINSVHHQAVKRLAEGAVIEAVSPSDGVIEALWIPGEAYVRGLQWHPEFDRPRDPTLLDSGPVLHDFLQAARARRSHAS